MLQKSLKIVLFICLFTTSLSVFAQEESPISFGADVMSRYIWRGVNLGGNSPSIQPWLKVTAASKDTSHVVALGAWGAISTSELKSQEIDLVFSYTFKNIITFWFTDYFFPKDTLYSRNLYFNYNDKTTGHVFEPCLTFNGTEKIPFTLMLAMNVYGADVRKQIDDGNGGFTSGDIMMSKYVELGYKKNIKGVDFNAFLGAVIDDPNEDKGEYGFYANRSAGFVNIGIKAAKKIKITDKFELPVQAQLITNPEAENIYFVFGISF